MAAKDPNKSEQPTAKRLSEARSKGTVLMSQDIISVASVVVGSLLVIVTAPKVSSTFQELLQAVQHIDCRHTWTLQECVLGIRQAGGILASLLVFPLVALGSVSVASVWGQIGPYFEMEPLTWKLDELNPASGMKRVLPSVQNTMKLVLALLKIVVIGFFIYLALRKDLLMIVTLPLQPIAHGVEWMHHQAVILTFKILALFVVLAGIDYAYRRKDYFDRLMMTKQEVKDELRNAEGDPQVKGRLRRRMRELTALRLIAEVPQADVVVVNPIHVAVALRYTPGSAAPRVVAKGLRKRALRIREIAETAQVPVIEDPPLARAIYRSTPQGKYISSRFFRAVATILAQLQQTGVRRFA